MTTNEQKTINELFNMVNMLKEQNDKFREELNIKVNGLEKQIEQKQLPLSLENQVIHSINDVLVESLKKSLSTGYNSPLDKYANNVISKYQKNIESIFDKIISNGISNVEFDKVVKIKNCN